MIKVAAGIYVKKRRPSYMVAKPVVGKARETSKSPVAGVTFTPPAAG